MASLLALGDRGGEGPHSQREAPGWSCLGGFARRYGGGDSSEVWTPEAIHRTGSCTRVLKAVFFLDQPKTYVLCSHVQTQSPRWFLNSFLWCSSLPYIHKKTILHRCILTPSADVISGLGVPRRPCIRAHLWHPRRKEAGLPFEIASLVHALEPATQSAIPWFTRIQ